MLVKGQAKMNCIFASQACCSLKEDPIHSFLSTLPLECLPTSHLILPVASGNGTQTHDTNFLYFLPDFLFRLLYRHVPTIRLDAVSGES